MLEASEAYGEIDTDRPGDRARLRDLEAELRAQSTGFEGAYPYLELIARANRIADPLDRRVVESYWLGGPLSDRAGGPDMTRSLEQRFRRRLPARTWGWLAGKPAAGARPTHAFHVLDVFPRVGLMRSGDTGDVLGLIDACRIRWGRVVDVAPTSLTVNAVPLELVDGRFGLGPARLESVQRWPAGDPSRDTQVGDVVSLHWDWACEVLTDARLAGFIARTQAQIDITNATT